VLVHTAVELVFSELNVFFSTAESVPKADDHVEGLLKLHRVLEVEVREDLKIRLRCRRLGSMRELAIVLDLKRKKPQINKRRRMKK
jgi:hypothetical protein